MTSLILIAFVFFPNNSLKAMTGDSPAALSGVWPSLQLHGKRTYASVTPYTPPSLEERRLDVPTRTSSTPLSKTTSGSNNGLIADLTASIVAPYHPGSEELKPFRTSSTPSSTVHQVGNGSTTSHMALPPIHNNQPSSILVAITNIPPGTRPRNLAGGLSPSLPGSPILRSVTPNQLGSLSSPSSPCDPAVYINDSGPSTPCGRGTPNGSSDLTTGAVLAFSPLGRTISSGADSPMLVEEKEATEENENKRI